MSNNISRVINRVTLTPEGLPTSVIRTNICTQQVETVLQRVWGLYEYSFTIERGYTYTVTIMNRFSTHEYFEVDIIKSFVEDVKNLLCGCPCKDCEDCGKKSKDYIDTLVKLMSYNITQNHNCILCETNHCIKCDILDFNECTILNEQILGSFDNTNLLKKLIGYYYTVFYFADLRDQEEQPIENLYEYSTISKCIRKLGINTECIENTIITPVEPPVEPPIITYNFDVEGDWVESGIIDESSFITFLLQNTNYVNIGVQDFTLTNNRLQANVLAEIPNPVNIEDYYIEFENFEITKVYAIGQGFQNIYKINLNNNLLTEFNPVIELPNETLYAVQLSGNLIDVAGWTTSEQWINLQTAFTNPFELSVGNNIDSPIGSTFETILNTKNGTLIL